MKVSRGGSVGSGMSDMLADALVNSNRFIVLERQHVKDVMAEQDFGRSGRVKRETGSEVR
jgi:curli biogenesis system outer membrane secretion channel CsgG